MEIAKLETMKDVLRNIGKMFENSTGNYIIFFVVFFLFAYKNHI